MSNINTEHASRRIDEMADEIQTRYAQMGKDVSFGFDTGIAAMRFIEAAQLIGNAEDRLLDPLALAFVLQPQDAALIKKSGEYPFKFMVAMLVCAQVRILIEQAGESDKFNTLYGRVNSASTPEIQRKAQVDLMVMAAPYFMSAQKIVQGHVEVYSPANPNGPCRAFKVI